MTMTLHARPRVSAEARLVVRREGIEFRDVGPGRVTIEITVKNEGPDRSAPTVARIEAAPFGAFVTGRHLADLDVPSLEPGESVVLRTEASRVAPKTLGTPDRVPPHKLLTAVGTDDDEPRPRGLRAWTGRARPAQRTFALPPDLLEMMGRPNPHWAGNLNVFIGREAVERHMARALRIYPGRTNLAFFIVGERPDSYRFDLNGYGSGWDVALYDAMRAGSMALGIQDGRVVVPSTWVDVPGQQMMLLAICPPETCGQGQVGVTVTQRSTMRTALVEFSFDPAASGPGCYVVA